MVRNLLSALVLTGFLGAAFSAPHTARADGEEVAVSESDEGAEATNSGAPSAASFDKRLPPVIPGEEITHNGKTTKVWSTSGPVPVSGEPEPWNEHRHRRHGDDERPDLPLGVIVDKGHEHSRR